MDIQEYNQKLEKFVTRVIAIIGVVLAMVIGCATTNAGGNGPDHTSAGDTNSIVHHAKKYWGQNENPTKIEPIEVPIQQREEVEVDQPDESAIAEAVAKVVQKFRQACQSKQEFYINHNGVKERYACLDISKYGNIPIDWSRVKEEHSDYVF